jgi:hypothetical protein
MPVFFVAAKRLSPMQTFRKPFGINTCIGVAPKGLRPLQGERTSER